MIDESERSKIFKIAANILWIAQHISTALSFFLRKYDKNVELNIIHFQDKKKNNKLSSKSETFTFDISSWTNKLTIQHTYHHRQNKQDL